MGHERAQNDWLWSKVGTLRNTEHKKPGSLSKQTARSNSHAFNAQCFGVCKKWCDSGGTLRFLQAFRAECNFFTIRTISKDKIGHIISNKLS